VLYGDNHVGWYGDPQQQLIWWNKYWTARLTLSSYPLTWPYNTGIVNAGNANWSSSRRANQHIGGRAVWHLIDQANGVDVDTKMCQQSPHSFWSPN